MGSEAREGSQDGLVAQLGRVLHSQFANQGVVGWVVEMGDCAAGWAHPLEKSGSEFVDTSIHSYP